MALRRPAPPGEPGRVPTVDDIVDGWSRALVLRDDETVGHSRRVTAMVVDLARVIGIGEAELPHIRRGALLHDVGKMGIPDAILLKPGPLSDDEWAVMRRHPEYAHDLLAPIDFLRPALDIPYCPPRAVGRDRLPAGARGRADPAGGAGVRRGGRLGRAEPRPAVPQGVARGAGQRPHRVPVRDAPGPRGRGGPSPDTGVDSNGEKNNDLQRRWRIIGPS